MTPERQYVPLPTYRTKDAIEQTLAAGLYEEFYAWHIVPHTWRFIKRA
jgi:hypothetical protein